MLLDLTTHEKYLRQYLTEPGEQVPYAANVIILAREYIAASYCAAPESTAFRKLCNTLLRSDGHPELSRAELQTGLTWLRAKGVPDANA